MAVTLCLCGDVMVGRGIDQILPHPADPQLYEPYVTSAAGYVALAEAANGPIPRPVPWDYVWGAAPAAWRRAGVDARIINLETSITASLSPWPKGINYKMAPDNANCLAAAGITCCTLANNHVLDWGEEGLLETLDTLRAHGIATAGRGAARPRQPPPPSFRCPRADASSSSPSATQAVASPGRGTPHRMSRGSTCCPT